MSNADRGGAYHPLIELTFARLREFIREPEALFWTFVFPIVMSIVMAIAFPSRGTQPVPIGVEGGIINGGIAEGGAARIRATLSRVPGIVVRDIPPGGEQRALREGGVHLIVIPGDPPTYRFDSARPESRTARLVVDDALKRALGRTDPWTAGEEPVQVAGSRYIDWLIPGIVALGIMGGGLWGIAFSIVQARMRKLLKRMVASPMRKREYLLAQLLARLLFLAPEVAVPLAFGMLAFGMPINGSLVAIAVMSVVGALAFGALGLLIGSRARTFEAVSGLANMAMLPMWLLSGVFFSTSNFPASLQPIIRLLPLTLLVDGLRAVVLEGTSLRGAQAELLGLALWTAVPFAVALRIFRWR